MTYLWRLGCISVLTFVVSFGCGSEDEGSGASAGGAPGSGGTAPGGAGGTASGGAASGGAASGGQGSGGDAAGGQNSGGANSDVDVDDLGQWCTAGSCPVGLTPTTYCGFAGCEQTSFCSCEIPCDEDPEVCPEGSACATVSDGPGTVCVPS